MKALSRKSVRIFAVTIGFAVASALTTGCATTHTAGWESDSAGEKLGRAEEAQAMSVGKRHWTKRDDRAELEKALAQFEKVAESNPSNYEALVFLSRGYYLMADAHSTEKDEAKKFWETGLSWGERALATNAGFNEKVVKGGAKLEEALDTLTKREVDALYWSAVNLGKWAKNSNIGTMLKYKGRIKDMITRVGELDPDFFYGAVPRYWGVYYAVAPFFAGGSMEKSKESFDQSLRIANGYLATHVLYAENYATKKGDKEMFRKSLEYVLKADENVLPDVTPEQRIEKRKAKKMLAGMEEFF